MTAEQKQMAVAVIEDVLRQLDRSDVPLRVTRGSGYLQGHANVGLEGDLGPVVDQVQAGCGVCMLGALFLSKARLYDAIPLSTFIRYADDASQLALCGEGAYASLQSVFDVKTLELIESAFESRDMPDGDRRTFSAPIEAAIRFGRRRPVFIDRARAIARNVIAHGGEFRPELDAAEASIAPAPNSP